MATRLNPGRLPQRQNPGCALTLKPCTCAMQGSTAAATPGYSVSPLSASRQNSPRSSGTSPQVTPPLGHRRTLSGESAPVRLGPCALYPAHLVATGRAVCLEHCGVF